MATAAVKNLEIPQGTDWSEQFQILDELGGVIALSTVTSIKGEARRIADHTTTVGFTFTITLNTSTNIATSTVLKAVTSALIVGPTKTHVDSKFHYDYEILFATGVTDRIQQGTCVIDREITAI